MTDMLIFWAEDYVALRRGGARRDWNDEMEHTETVRILSCEISRLIDG